MTTYALESSSEELDRLLRASRLLGPIAASAIRQTSLQHGGRAIDVGCGPLGALPVLHDAVGDDGTVVGVDLSAGALATAAQALERLGITGVRLVEADVNSLTPADFDGVPFDLAYCRLVLMHQADPAATLQVIARLLRPGGSLVAFDFFAPPCIEPAIPAVDRAWQLIIAAMRARGASPDTSRRYREHCAAAGLEVVAERGTFIPMPLQAVLNETTVLLSGVRHAVEAHGLATVTEVGQLLDELQSAMGTATGQAWSPQTIELIARKPV